MKRTFAAANGFASVGLHDQSKESSRPNIPDHVRGKLATSDQDAKFETRCKENLQNRSQNPVLEDCNHDSDECGSQEEKAREHQDEHGVDRDDTKRHSGDHEKHRHKETSHYKDHSLEEIDDTAASNNRDYHHHQKVVSQPQSRSHIEYHDHGHSHGHGHENDHGHSHSHDHDHDHDHDHGHDHDHDHDHDPSLVEVEIRPGVTKHVVCVRHSVGDHCTCPSCTNTETANHLFWDKLYAFNAENHIDSEYLLTFQSIASTLLQYMTLDEPKPYENIRVLLPGCGDSQFSLELFKATNFKYLTNTDVSQVAIDVQNRLFNEDPRVINMVDDAINTRLKHNTFDFVIDKSLFDCLSYCSEDRVPTESRLSKLLAGFYNILLPGGRCLVIASDHNEPAVFLPYISEIWSPVNDLLMDQIARGIAALPKPWEVLAVTSIDFDRTGGAVSRNAPVLKTIKHHELGHDLWNCETELVPEDFPTARFWCYVLRKRPVHSPSSVKPAKLLPPPLLGTLDNSTINESLFLEADPSDHHSLSNIILNWAIEVVPSMLIIETTCREWIKELRLYLRNPYRIREKERLCAEKGSTSDQTDDVPAVIRLPSIRKQFFHIALCREEAKYVAARRQIEMVLRREASALEMRWISQKLGSVRDALDRVNAILEELNSLLPAQPVQEY